MPKPKDAPPFPGFVMPAYTMTPNHIFDWLMPDLNLSETRVLLYIVRHTFGWQKEADAIGVRQFCEGIKRRDGTRVDRGTGLGRSTVLAAIKSLEEWGIIDRQENRDPEGGDLPSTYRLRLARGSEIPDTGSPAGRTPPGQDAGPPESGQPDPQNLTDQNNDQNGSVTSLAEIQKVLRAANRR